MSDNLLLPQDTCEMTIVPGGIIEYAYHQTATTILRALAVNSSPSEQLQKIAPLPLTIPIDAPSRSITLMPKPLSHKYDYSIMRAAGSGLAFLRYSSN